MGLCITGNKPQWMVNIAIILLLQEQFVEDAHRVFWTVHSMSNGPGITIDFIVISALFYISENPLVQTQQANLISLVPEEMYFLKTFVFNMFQGKSLIPPIGKHIKRYLTPDGVC